MGSGLQVIFESCDFWDGLLDTTEDEYIAVLKGYLDASTREDSGLLSVGVYLFESTRVRRFRQQWRNTFGGAKFSWADLIARRFPFEHLSDRHDPVVNRAHDRLVAAGVSLVREHVIGGSIASIWIQDVKNYSPAWIKGFGHAYSIAGHMAMVGIANWAKENQYRGGISYVIEAGDDGYDQLKHLLSYPAKVPDAADLYQWAGDSVTPKTSCSPFHAPDLLAWEWGKFMMDTGVTAKRRMRRSLANLLIGRVHAYSFNHLAGEPLMKFFSRIHALGVEQLQEARAELQPVSSIDVSDSVESSAQTEPDGDPE